MNILVAGGTGLIGSHVLRELLATRPSERLHVLTRDPGRPHPLSAHVRRVRGDVGDPASLAQAVRGMDVVIHAVQFPNHPVENPRKGWTYLEVDGRGTVNMVAACRKAGVQRFIYLSGAGVRPGRTEPWFQAKAMAEEAIQRSGLPYVIIRPSWVYGPGDRSVNKFVKMARLLPFMPVIGDGEGKVQPVSVFDVARVVTLAVDLPEATNRIFEAGGPEALTMNQILQTVLRVVGKRRPLVHHPVGFMKAVASILQVLPNPPLTPAAIDFILMEERVDPTETERVFGVKFERFQDGLRRYLGPRR